MNVNWEAIGAIGEVLGAIVTIGTIAYLAVQVRSSREATQAATELETSAQLNQIVNAVAKDKDMQRIWNLVASDSDALTAEEAEYFTWNVTAMLHMCEGVWEQYKRGLLSKRTWDEWERSMAGVLRMPLLRYWWRNRVAPFSPELFEHFDKLIESDGVWTMPNSLHWITNFLESRDNS